MSVKTHSADGSALVLSMILILLLTVLGTSLLSMSGLESKMSHNDLWSEGALHAAEAGVHAGLEQLEPDPAASTLPIPVTTISVEYDFRSGDRMATTAQALQYLGKQKHEGFAIGVGTGYNPSGYSFARYRINATGGGPRNVRREVEALAEYGPVAE